MLREVITYPDKRLKTLSAPVTRFDTDLHALLDDMYETMLSKNGIGLAAIQIAVPQRVLIINLPNEEDEQLKSDLYEMINPEILAHEGGTTYQEGCLSVPGFYEEVERFASVIVRYTDREGTLHELSATGLLAVAIQHEMDHLDGKLFIEKLSYARRKKFEKELKKAQREAKKAS